MKVISSNSKKTGTTTNKGENIPLPVTSASHYLRGIFWYSYGHFQRKFTNCEVKLHVNPNVTPVQQPIRRIPYHTRKKVTAELQRLLDLDIIDRVNGPTS